MDSVAPNAPTITVPADGSVSNEVSPTIRLSGEPGTSATVKVDGVDYGPVQLDGSGHGHLTLAGSLSAGQHAVRARLTDDAGNQASDNGSRIQLRTLILER
jgi:hypothetical protein